MGRYLRQEEEGIKSVQCEERTFTQLKAGGSKLAQEILRLLSKEPLYSHEIGKRLNVHEQKIYYHIRKLEKAGLIKVDRREEIGGGSAKYYTLASPAFAITLTEPTPGSTITSTPAKHQEFLKPFITEGKADFLIVVGNPEAHGPKMVQARDGSYAIDLALFLGSYLSERPEPVIKLDTEFKEEDWHRNLIVIGGPIVNTVTAKINTSLPIHFLDNGKSIASKFTKKSYESDQVGIVVKTQNPRDRRKEIIFIAGRRQAGTKAAILSFLKHFDELIEGNQEKQGEMARVVEGRDLDSDGVVDDLIFRE